MSYLTWKGYTELANPLTELKIFFAIYYGGNIQGMNATFSSYFLSTLFSTRFMLYLAQAMSNSIFFSQLL